MQCRRLAGTVGTEQPDDLALADGEAHLPHGGHRAEPLRERQSLKNHHQASVRFAGRTGQSVFAAGEAPDAVLI
ncbi:hypothetical protein GCM10017559_74530 [Streptosporangium longisporum]|uniref:Uncharacterized protein n=1 Tax=Streptosporangium longisporum TaxID=46187 RepID=A0ABP6LB13_9ACTN